MKKLSLCLIGLWFSITGAMADVYFTGEIEQINNQSIGFSDQYFILSPTVKVQDVNKNKISLSKLNLGDSVTIKLVKIGSKHLVDSIRKLPLIIEEER